MKQPKVTPTIIAARPRYFGRLLLVIFAVSALLTLLFLRLMPATFHRAPEPGVANALAVEPAARVSNMLYAD